MFPKSFSPLTQKRTIFSSLVSFAGYLLNVVVLKNNMLANFLFTVSMETKHYAGVS